MRASFGEEIGGGEVDASEYVAGGVCRKFTLLFGDAEIVYGYKHLNLTYKLNDREKSESNVGGVSRFSGRKGATSEEIKNAGRNCGKIVGNGGSRRYF